MAIIYRELGKDDETDLKSAADLVSLVSPDGVDGASDVSKTSYQDVLFAMENYGSRILGAFDGDTLIGCGSFQRLEAEEGVCGYLYHLRVDSKYQRQGIGKELVERRIELLKDLDDIGSKVDRVIMRSAPESGVSRTGFFEKIGFEDIGTDTVDGKEWIVLEKNLK